MNEYTDAKDHIFELLSDGTLVIQRISWRRMASQQIGRTPSVDDPMGTGDFRDDSQQMILYRAIFGEGRNLPELCRIAIGWVIRNRVDQGKKTHHEVILRPKHFSAFNENDPNRRIVENPLINANERKAWTERFELAGKIISDTLPDPTAGADHYHTIDVHPEWARGMEQTLRVGNTLFIAHMR